MSQPVTTARSRSFFKRIRPVVETLVLIFLMLLVLRSTMQNFHIRGHSMEPTLHDQEYMLVNKAAYLFQSPQRGDIVVFRYPYNPEEDYVKRVIAVPGDVITVIGKRVTVNNVNLHETYVAKKNAKNPYAPIVKQKIEQDEYFVMGDNRSNSSDSREWGFVPSKNIIGKAILVYWPFDADNFGLLPDKSDVFAQVQS